MSDYETITLRIPRRLLQMINDYGSRYGMNTSDTIRYIIVTFFEVGENER